MEQTPLISSAPEVLQTSLGVPWVEAFEIAVGNKPSLRTIHLHLLVVEPLYYHSSASGSEGQPLECLMVSQVLQVLLQIQLASGAALQSS